MKRRVRLIGKPSVTQRKSGPAAGLWIVQVVAEVDGERRRVVRSARSESNAYAKVPGIMDELATPVPTLPKEPAPVVTLEDVAERYLTTTLPLSGAQPSTREQYAGTVRRDIVPILGADSVVDITVAQVEDLVMRYAGHSASTRKRVLDVLRYVLDVAVRDGHVSVNVARQVKRPKQDPPSPKAYEDDELATLLAAVADDRLGPLWTLMAWTGLRVNEALALADEDVQVDGDDPRLWVRGSLRRITGEGLTLGPGKSRAARRWIPLAPEAVAAVRRWRASRAADRLAAGPLWEDSGFLFTTEAGGPLDSRNATRSLRKAARDAGLRTGSHVLRHTFATDLVRDGVPVRQVQELLGHASPMVTLATYSKVTAEDRRGAIERLGQSRRTS